MFTQGKVRLFFDINKDWCKYFFTILLFYANGKQFYIKKSPYRTKR